MDAHTHQHNDKNESIYVLSADDLSLTINSPKFCVGIHPWDISRYHELKGKVLEKSADSRCVAIGETGLDRLYPDLDLQLVSLQWHWDLAEERGKPLVLHLVRSSSDILALLKKRRPTTTWVWHDFQGPIEVVSKALKLHPTCYFSFGPRSLLRPNSKHLWDEVPAHLRLIETDDSGLSIDEVLMMSKASADHMSKNFHTAFSF